MQNCNKNLSATKTKYALFFYHTFGTFSSRFFSRLPLFFLFHIAFKFLQTKEICTLVLYVCYCVQSVMETSPKNPVRETSHPSLHKPLLLETSHITTPTINILHTQNTALPHPNKRVPYHQLSDSCITYSRNIVPWTTYIIIGPSSNKKKIRGSMVEGGEVILSSKDKGAG